MSDEFFGTNVGDFQVSGAGTSGVESRAPNAGVSIGSLTAKGLGGLLEGAVSVKETFDRAAIDDEALKAEDISQTLKMDSEFISRETGLPAALLRQQNPSTRYQLLIQNRREALKRKYPGYEQDINAAFTNVREDSRLLAAELNYRNMVDTQKRQQEQLQQEVDQYIKMFPNMAGKLAAGDPRALDRARTLSTLRAEQAYSEEEKYQTSRAASVTAFPTIFKGIGQELFEITDPAQAANMLPDIEATETSLNAMTAGLTGDRLERMEELLKPHRETLKGYRDYIEALGTADQAKLDQLKRANAIRVEAMRQDFSGLTILASDYPELFNLMSVFGGSEAIKQIESMADNINSAVKNDLTRMNGDAKNLAGAENGVKPAQEHSPTTSANILNNGADPLDKFPETQAGEDNLILTLRGANEVANPDALVNGLTQKGFRERVLSSENPEAVDLYFDLVGRAESALMSRVSKDVNLVMTQQGYRIEGYEDMTLAEARRIAMQRPRTSQSMSVVSQTTDRERAALRYIQHQDTINRLNKLRGISSERETIRPSDMGSFVVKPEPQNVPETPAEEGPIQYESFMESFMADPSGTMKRIYDQFTAEGEMELEYESFVDVFKKDPMGTLRQLFGEGEEASPLTPASAEGGGTSVNLDTLAMIESSGDASAVSPAGAIGKYQIMPKTAADPGYGITPLSTGKDVAAASEEEQKRFAGEFLSVAERKLGSKAAAIAAYNAGIGRVDQVLSGKGRLPQETQDYLAKFVRAGELTREEVAVVFPDWNNLQEADIGSGIEALANKVIELFSSGEEFEGASLRAPKKPNKNPRAPMPKNKLERKEEEIASSFGATLDHAITAVKYMTLSMMEDFYGDSAEALPEEYRTVTEKDLSEDVLAEIRRVALDAKRSGKPTTSYFDFNESVGRMVQDRRNTSGSEQVETILSSFSDPSTAAAFVVGMTSTGNIYQNEEGEWILEDKFDFPDLSGIDENSPWIMLNKLFGPNGVFNVSEKNKLKIKINLGKE